MHMVFPMISAILLITLQLEPHLEDLQQIICHQLLQE